MKALSLSAGLLLAASAAAHAADSYSFEIDGRRIQIEPVAAVPEDLLGRVVVIRRAAG